MKKNYTAPNTMTTKVELQQMIAESNGVYSNVGLKFGGTDSEGTLSPSSRQGNSLWDEEDEW